MITDKDIENIDNNDDNIEVSKQSANILSNEEYTAYKLEAKRKEQRRIERHQRIIANRIVLAAAIILTVAIGIKMCAGKSTPVSTNTDSSTSYSQTEKNNIKKSSASEENTNTNVTNDTNTNKSTNKSTTKKAKSTIVKKDGVTYVNGIMIVNKTYSMPSTYNKGIDETAMNAFNKMAYAASQEGLTLFINSGFRSYQQQQTLYNGYATTRGTAEADKVSSRPGHSEHQTGLAFDVNSTDFSFADTAEAKWLENNCCKYGFIIRFPKGKESKTGYEYEAWHIRYLGEATAKKVHDSGLCLEEYLGVTSDYKYCTTE